MNKLDVQIVEQTHQQELTEMNRIVAQHRTPRSCNVMPGGEKSFALSIQRERNARQFVAVFVFFFVYATRSHALRIGVISLRQSISSSISNQSIRLLTNENIKRVNFMETWQKFAHFAGIGRNCRFSTNFLGLCCSHQRLLLHSLSLFGALREQSAVVGVVSKGAMLEKAFVGDLMIYCYCCSCKYSSELQTFIHTRAQKCVRVES